MDGIIGVATVGDHDGIEGRILFHHHHGKPLRQGGSGVRRAYGPVLGAGKNVHFQARLRLAGLISLNRGAASQKEHASGRQ
jgi:hypothetical protein